MRNRHGMLLFEMMFSLLLIASLAVVAERLFTLSCKLCADAPGQQEAIIRLQSAVETLREDAWHAHAFTVDPDHSIHIDGGAVTWSIDATGDALRVDQHDTRRWPGGFGKATLAIDGPCILLRSPGDNIRLVSQFQLLSANQGKL